MILHVAQAGRERLIPRTLLQAAAWLYDEAVTNGRRELPRSEAEHLLTELKWDE